MNFLDDSLYEVSSISVPERAYGRIKIQVSTETPVIAAIDLKSNFVTPPEHTTQVTPQWQTFRPCLLNGQQVLLSS
jgi:hypothetical protein